ncbi:carbohydrate ABC transporter permease [Beduinella massiliensis]|uniref:carbohydrate ABC transporter permease n=1 Tax=Beduinella massiliensis TaxID=1852363 RepID=UPI000C82B89A
MDGVKLRRIDKLWKGVVFLLLLVFSLFCLYPVLYVLFASFSDPNLLTAHSGLLLRPVGFSLKGYEVALSYRNIGTGYMNTLFVVAVGTAVNMFLTTIGAYALSRKDIMVNKFVMLMVTFCMFFSGGMIPTFLNVKNLGLLDSLWALILPSCISVWNLIILRTGFLGVPDSLEESAKLDGASDVTILLRIEIPLVKASMAVVTLYYLVGHWNAWFDAMLYMRTRDKYPLQLILREILVSNTSSSVSAQGFNPSEADLYKRLVKYTTTVIATVPILFIYPFLQKYFVNGVMVGSVKG